MKKVIALLLVCLMASFVSKANADTRTDSLGLTAGQQVDDLDSIWLYPEDAAKFGNVADYRLGVVSFAANAGDNWFGAIHKDFDEIGYLGFYANRPFQQSNGIAPVGPIANQNGILNGNVSWQNIANPANFAAGVNFVGDFNYGGGANITATYNGFTSDFTLNTPSHELDLFWAKDFSGTTFGVHINYANNDNANDSSSFTKTSPGAPGAGTSTANTDQNSSQVMGVDLGLGLKDLGALSALDLSVGYSMGLLDYSAVQTAENAGATGTNIITNDKVKDKSISEIRANVLAKAKINDAATGRIFANARIDSFGWTENGQFDFNNDGNFTDGAETQSWDSIYNDTNVNVGLACSHSVADGKATVIVGLTAIWDNQKWSQPDGGFNLAGTSTITQVWTNQKDTEEQTWLALPLNVAVEAPLFSWLKARVGASRNLLQSWQAKISHSFNPNAAGTTLQDTNSATITNDVPGNVTMTYGVGASFENFNLDLQVSQGGLESYLGGFQPGNGIFYNNGATNLFTQADLRYMF